MKNESGEGPEGDWSLSPFPLCHPEHREGYRSGVKSSSPTLIKSQIPMKSGGELRRILPKPSFSLPAETCTEPSRRREGEIGEVYKGKGET
jgi:hypothetical protein